MKTFSRNHNWTTKKKEKDEVRIGADLINRPHACAQEIVHDQDSDTIHGFMLSLSHVCHVCSPPQIGDIKIYLMMGKEILAKTQVPVWDVPVVPPARDGEEPAGGTSLTRLERTSMEASFDPLNTKQHLLSGEEPPARSTADPEAHPQAGATSDILDQVPKAGFP